MKIEEFERLVQGLPFNPTLRNDDMLFRGDIRQDFFEALLQDPRLEKKIGIGKELKKTMRILAAMDNWERQVLDTILWIKRYIQTTQEHDREETMIQEAIQELTIKLFEIAKSSEELEGENSPIRNKKSGEEASDSPLKSTPGVGESSNGDNQKNDEPTQNLSTGQLIRDCLCSLCTPCVGKSSKYSDNRDEPTENLSTNQLIRDCLCSLCIPGVGKSSKYSDNRDEPTENLSTDQLIRDWLCSLAIFPENTKLKKKLLVHWWIGLGLVSYGDESVTDKPSAEFVLSTLVKQEILKPSRIRHYKVDDSFTINPTNYKKAFSTFEERIQIKPVRMNEAGTGISHVYVKDDKELAVLNVDQKQMNSKCISKSSTLQVVQLGKWHYTEQEEFRYWTFYRSIKRTDYIEVDGTAFLENMGQAVTYLSLNGISRIENLPQSVGNIRGLMILDLKDCHSLQRLPQKPKPTIREKLRKEQYYWFKELRYLDITGCYLLDHVPKWICELSDLQVLKGAVFNGFITDYCRLQDLSKLQKLKKLSIKLINPESLAPEDFTGLKSLHTLRVLTIVWRMRETVETEKQSRDDVNDRSNISGTGGEQATTVNEDEIAPRENQSRENAVDCLKIFRSCSKRIAGVKKDKMVDDEQQSKENSLSGSSRKSGVKKTQGEHKHTQKVQAISFPENLEKLDIRCYPNAHAQELLDPAKLKNLKRLYIRGGKLAKFNDDAGWQVEILRLRFLEDFCLNWYEIGGIFPNLKFVEYEFCPTLIFFPESEKRWIKEINGPFPRPYDPFIDDREPTKEIKSDEPMPSTGRDVIQLETSYDCGIPLAKKKQTVTVELEPKGLDEMPGEEIPELDLVMVLDVRENMKGEKLEKMKTAMLYFIDQFNHVIRLSIVTFGTEAKRQSPLCPVTINSETEFINLINSLEADGCTNTSYGLQMALKVLKDRKFGPGRATCIMLVSGSDHVSDDAAPVPTGDVSVHTIGLGKDYNRTVLESIATNSRKGTFREVSNTDDLGAALYMCLVELLNLPVIQDLTLTFTPVEGESTIEHVDAGTNSQFQDNTKRSFTVKINNPYGVNKVTVNLLLQATQERIAETLDISYSYRRAQSRVPCEPNVVTVHACILEVTKKISLSDACFKLQKFLNQLTLPEHWPPQKLCMELARAVSYAFRYSQHPAARGHNIEELSVLGLLGLKYLKHEFEKWPFTVDDEPIEAIKSAKPMPSSGRDVIQLKTSYDCGIPLAEKKQTVTVELKSKELREMPSEEIPKLDLVMVLDVRESMKGEKLEKMKTAMQYFFNKFNPVIRLSIVTFGTNARKQCRLCPVTESYKRELTNLITKIKADGCTNTSYGLQMALDVLKDRKFGPGRATCIMLVSGSDHVSADAAPVPTGDVSVHTFGLGKDYNRTVLESIATNSRKGTFREVSNTDDLGAALYMCLVELLNLSVIQDLTLTLTPVEGESTIEHVDVGTNPQPVDNANGSVTVKIDNPYCKNKVTVGLLLHATRERIAETLDISYSYRLTPSLDSSKSNMKTVHACILEMTKETTLRKACDKLRQILLNTKQRVDLARRWYWSEEDFCKELARAVSYASRRSQPPAARGHDIEELSVLAPLIQEYSEREREK